MSIPELTKKVDFVSDDQLLFIFIAIAIKYCEKPYIHLTHRSSEQVESKCYLFKREAFLDYSMIEFASGHWNELVIEEGSYIEDTFNITFSNCESYNPHEHQSNHLAALLDKNNNELTLIINEKHFIPDVLAGIDSTLQYLLQQMKHNPNLSFSQGCGLTPEEWNIIEGRFNDTDRDWGEQINKTYSELLDNQVINSPDRVAIQYKDLHITFKDLNDKAEHMASSLSKHGATYQSRIPVLTHRSIDLITVIFAIWKLGAIYIPLDPNYPTERIQTILSDCQPDLIIVTEPASSVAIWKTVTMDSLKSSAISASGSYSPSFKTPESLAYIIYTSGTTGKPKGVMIEHRGMINHLLCKIEDLHITEDSIVAQTASQCFDISIWQMFSSLLVGGRIVIYDNDTLLNPNQFLSSMVEDRIDIVEFVPSYLNTLLKWIERKPRTLSSLRYLIVTGEILKFNLVDRWFNNYPHIPIVNAYGPTEASDDITHAFIYSNDVTHIPIGRPIQNMRIYIINQDYKLCPIGVKGEIIVTGIGVGKGYWQDEYKTNKAFVTLTIPNTGKEEQRFYRTGDIGCWTDSGEILYFGRIDDQIKIKGYRIELLEIDHALGKCHGVEEAVTITEENKNGDMRLVSFIVSKTKDASSHIRHELMNYLPAYMVPEHIRVVMELPLTPNGKIDRSKLKEFIYF
ncbi:amino acid adenylation domain-containing protein [Paenibacillus sp. NPDC057967]|uniref:amino acid adenylation domain-containing protein n=1 Tax=Paenibacillus sp. NPDC057967 TaxID=3346293 RepID=UPI0036DFA339